MFRLKAAEESSNLIIGMQFGKILCLDIDSEGIVWFKGDVLEDLHASKVNKLTLLSKPWDE